MKTVGYRSFKVSSANTSTVGSGFLKVLLAGLGIFIIGWLIVKFFFPKKANTKSENKELVRSRF